MKIEMNLISDKGKNIPIGEMDMELVFREDVLVQRDTPDERPTVYLIDDPENYGPRSPLPPPLVEFRGESIEMSEITALIRGVKIVGNYQNVRKKPILITGTHIDMDHTIATSKLLYPEDSMQVNIILNM